MIRQTNNLQYLKRGFTLFGLAAIFSGLLALPAFSQDAEDEAVGEIYVLSPFEVSTELDNGYAATNTIAGSRIDTAIKDIPIAIQVFTSEFISDTGATDLRGSLAYAANITLNSQNDLENSGGVGGIQDTPYGPGGVNNPSGVTSNVSGTQLKVRGFLTNNVLRNGFLRGSPSDAINIDRVEVVQGPNALLYGTGNFGGVVDYLTKRPLDIELSEATFSVGTNNFYRATIDKTGPLSKENHINYRLIAAWESSDTHIDHAEYSRIFIAPSLEWKPSERTNLLINAEYVSSDSNGNGFRALRAAAGTGATPINNDQLEATGFYWPPGADRRTWNLSGPDTFNDQELQNIEATFTQQLLDEGDYTPGLFFLAGVNYSKWELHTQDANGGIEQVSEGNPGFELSQSIELTALDNGPDGRTPANDNLQYGIFENAVIRNTWGQLNSETQRDQVRFEFSGYKNLFDGSWYRMEDQFLIGWSSLRNEIVSDKYETLPEQFSFKGPLDLDPIRFATQGDGSPAPGLYQNNRDNVSLGWDKAYYVNNFLKLLDIWGVDNRLTLMAGARWDEADNYSTNTTVTAPTADPPSVASVTTAQADTTRITSKQYGLMFRITNELSLFALQADGFQPNFGGLRESLTGVPVGADTAESEEIGIKFDFLEGKISGSISSYKITKDAWKGAGFSTPAPLNTLAGHPRFDPNKPIIYNLGDANGTGFYNPFPDEFTPNGQTYTPNEVSQAAWIAAAEAGAITLTSPINGESFDEGSIYLNASTPEGAAWMDAFFNAAAGGWAGWPYKGNDADDPGINNATLDDGAFQNATFNNALPSISQAKGWDGMIQFSPIDNLQIVFSASVSASVKLIDPGKWIKYPYPEDRWATWYFPNGGFGLKGQSLEDAYTDPSDTSTRTNSGVFPGDDTPKNRFTMFGNYKFEDKLKGWTIGGGADWASKRAYFSGVTRGSGQIQRDTDGEVLVLYMPSQLNMDVFVRKEWEVNDTFHSLQLNVYNPLNDQGLYGYVYNAPVSAKLTYKISW